MTVHDKRDIRQWLEEKLSFLENRNISIETQNLPDDNEYASLVSELNVNVALREREGRQLQEIKAAIARLDDPGFGVCEECGDPIGLARLKANPQALFCIDCQANMEELTAA